MPAVKVRSYRRRSTVARTSLRKGPSGDEVYHHKVGGKQVACNLIHSPKSESYRHFCADKFLALSIPTLSGVRVVRASPKKLRHAEVVMEELRVRADRKMYDLRDFEAGESPVEGEQPLIELLLADLGVEHSGKLHDALLGFARYAVTVKRR